MEEQQSGTPTGTYAVFEEVYMERGAQDEKWGEQNHDNFMWTTILTEEVGEAAQAALHTKFGGYRGGQLRDELVQVAAVAVAWIECLDRRDD